eukprot:TRINITY_DN90937_c0_g1_i1.p1 TRINITY_DN90937_c0_g1~~TRINITY_DN90937_c0_g1_i1.p1  ORF type:complete len:101 (-),score=11.38 TRINITY_DN90937_c0_g1_i1:3-305(-)
MISRRTSERQSIRSAGRSGVFLFDRGSNRGGCDDGFGDGLDRLGRIDVFAGGFLEFLDGLAEALGETGEFAAAEEQHENGEDDQEFRSAKTEDAGKERCE